MLYIITIVTCVLTGIIIAGIISIVISIWLTKNFIFVDLEDSVYTNNLPLHWRTSRIEANEVIKDLNVFILIISQPFALIIGCIKILIEVLRGKTKIVRVIKKDLYRAQEIGNYERTIYAYKNNVYICVNSGELGEPWSNVIYRIDRNYNNNSLASKNPNSVYNKYKRAIILLAHPKPEYFENNTLKPKLLIASNYKKLGINEKELHESYLNCLIYG